MGRVVGILFVILGSSLVGFAAPSPQTAFDLRSESFISPDYRATDLSQYYFLGISVQTDRGEVAPQGLQLLASAELAPQAPEISYINPREVYFRSERFVVGRRLFTWSKTDEAWNLGLIQPQFRWNPLAPESQGLTGIYYDLQGPDAEWGVSLFASPLFVPDQGPGYVLRDGRFARINPWFQYQPTSVRVTGSDKVRALEYDIEVPPLDRLIVKTGAAAQLFFGREGGPMRFTISSAYKPSNQLNLGFSAVAEPNRARAFVSPAAFYHSVTAADLTLRAGGWDWVTGLLYETVEEPLNRRPDYTYFTYKPMTVASTSLGWQDANNGLRLSGLWRVGGEAVPLGDLGSDLDGFFIDRIPYRQAFEIRGSTSQRFFGGRPVVLLAAYQQSLAGDYRRLNGGAEYSLDRDWTLWGSFLLLQASNEAPSLFRDFEDNDSLQVGVRYVF